METVETYDYLFITCILLLIFSFFVIIINKIIPKDIMMKSKPINIKRGKIIGSILGVVIGFFISFYLWNNGYLDFMI